MASGVFQQHVLRLRRRQGKNGNGFKRMGEVFAVDSSGCMSQKIIAISASSSVFGILLNVDIVLGPMFSDVLHALGLGRRCQVSPLCCQHFGPTCER